MDSLTYRYVALLDERIQVEVSVSEDCESVNESEVLYCFRQEIERRFPTSQNLLCNLVVESL